ncbi:MAG: VIT domain-containing protein [Pirellulales bacterium]
MNPNDNNWDEERFAALLASTGGDAAPPDREFLDRLREQSTQVFLAESSQRTLLRQRRDRMFTLVIRGVAASVAAVIAVAALVWSSISPGDSAVAFGKVLESMSSADTLRLEITADGATGRVRAKRPGQLRWDRADGTYDIARGARLWSIDEKANRATSRATSFFGGEAGALDTLALVGLPQPADRAKVLDARPAERVKRDGVECDLYRVDLAAPQGKIHLEAVADASSHCLRTLEAKVDRDNGVVTLAKLNVVAVNEPMSEDVFVVGDTLTEDGRIGKVTDVQGIASIKPPMAARWTPLTNQLLLKPGDWLRTDLRGANAVAVRLVKETRVVLGPGTLVELMTPNRLRIHNGELKIVAAEKAPVELVGPDNKELKVEGTRIYRVEMEKLVPLAKAPLWLGGFEGATNNESLGSLVAKVDGRETPLSVGYHKVTVDIRDQIARTTVEESFVNHTGSQLEGVFYFPLPQDASISGFGMWIGDQLVEADVVEKQRAREIYETILRERRDPGLLEWSGGNIFKARVFPIFAHSEKRIKITYTQVLPLAGNAYRYSYALQSELLKQRPLRQLAIDVTLNSAAAIKTVGSPTHAARTSQTKHSARVEFTAQEYTPTRDFEVVVELDAQQPELVVIPHRRGEDGYFMLQLTPPAGDTAGQRGLLPDGEPLDVLILADTSASIDAAGREAQAEFIASLLSGLTAKDKFNIAGCDVECDWAFESAVPAEPKAIATARQFLSERVSLGWTDLDRAFAAALAKCGPKTRLVYVGDGIVSGKNSDPVAFGKRLRALYQGKVGACYAVSVGNSFESGVLKTIASLGGGSMRQISGEHGPRAAALELLDEFVRPAIHDLKVEFRGIRTARVYPEELPNLAAGAQQILLGRYLPEGKDQTGEVIVTGIAGDKPIRYTSRVSLKDAEQGNSFIPRLWARMHLDALLEQGASQAIQDEIIALSEEYSIITPYTSLLVLESDADRERFKVKRRFQMRDGEKFFTQGRDNAYFELVQQQMKRAGDWRIGLRREVLRQLGGLGRDTSSFQPRAWNRRLGGLGGGYGGSDRRTDYFSAGDYLNGAWDTSGLSTLSDSLAVNGPVSSPTPSYDGRFASPADESFEDGGELVDRLESRAKYESADKSKRGLEDAELSLEPAEVGQSLAAERTPFGFESIDYDLDFTRARGGAVAASRPMSAKPWSGLSQISERYDRGYGLGYGYYQAQPEQWLVSLFPGLSSPPPTPKPPTKPWPTAAQELAKSLLRTDVVAKLSGGLKIEVQSDSFEPRWNELVSQSSTLAWVAPKAWLRRYAGSGSQTTVEWCDGKQRGIFSLALQLGRQRASTPEDLTASPVDLGGFAFSGLDRAYADYTAELKPQGVDRTLVVIQRPAVAASEIRVLVDTARHVVVSIEYVNEGKTTATTSFGGFTEVAGAWWATRIEMADGEGRKTVSTSVKLEVLAADAFTGQVQAELAGRGAVQFLREPLASVIDAKRALAAGKATFDDQMALAMHFGRTQQWNRVLEHFGQAEKLASGKAGMRWVRNTVLNAARRREELRSRLLDEAVRLAAAPAGKADSEGLFLTGQLIGQASGILEANEMLTLLDSLKPVYERQVPYLHGKRQWDQQRVTWLQQAARAEEALQLQKELAEGYPHDYNLQQQYAQALGGAGECEAAYAWLKKAMAADAKWLPYEEESLWNTYASLLESQGRYDAVAGFFAEIVKRTPDSQTPYARYLSALVRADQWDEANRVIEAWLKEARVPGKLPAPVAWRAQAAIQLMLGNGYNLYTDRIDERWLAPLAETALYFSRHESAQFADSIMQHWRFQQSDACQDVRKKLFAVLVAELEKMTPAEVQRFVSWTLPTPEVETPTWKQIAATLRKRWAAASRPEDKSPLAQALVQVLSSRGTPAELIEFYRAQLAAADEESRPGFAQQLFDTLLNQPWSAEHEDEAFTLLDKLGGGDAPSQRLAAQVAAVHRLTDQMVKARFDARMKTVEHQEKLTRIELAAKKAENLRLAREEFADRLGKEAPRHGETLAPWIAIERAYLDAVVGRNLDKVEAECWEYLGTKPRPLAAADEAGRGLAELLRNRYLTTVLNLSARKSAKPELIDRVLKYLNEAIASEAGEIRWKLCKYQLLVALDRPKDLEQDLQQWLRADDPDNRWRLSLGYRQAEQGRLAEAIKQFELVQTDGELGPADYRVLADWYMATNRRDLYDRSLIEVYKTSEDWRLANWLSQKLYPWQRNDRRAPSELEKEVLLVFAALFEKSSNPENHLSALHQFYQATRDYRLLATMSDAVLGNTAGKVYPFLKGMKPVFGEIRDEATVDEIVAHVAELRSRAKTDVDRRALDLLELLVERRAAELKNQPGPHAAKALAALGRAFKRQWSPGEPRLVADFLAGLGGIPDAKLSAEQMRQLQVLLDQAAKGSADRLQIAFDLAQVQWLSGQGEKAVDLLESALNERQAAAGGILPATANDAMASFLSYLEQQNHHARGERYLFDQRKHPASAQQALWLTQKLYALYHHAVENDGEVSLGRGEKLYRAVQRQIQGEMETGDHNHRYALIIQLSSIYRAAHAKRIAGVPEDLKAFAFQRLPALLKRQTNNYQEVVRHVAFLVRDVVGTHDGLAFFVARMEDEPAWFRLNNQDGWSQFSYTLAEWRLAAPDLGDLDGRLLAIVTAALRRDLEARQHRNQSMYWRDNRDFWKEKEADFARTAEEVLEKRKGSGASVQFIASYLFNGLRHTDRAIEILFTAHQQKLLDDAGQYLLANFLQQAGRFGESIGLLVPLVERQPDVMQNRILLMRGYFNTKRREELLSALAATDAHFHKEGRWTESALAALALSCQQNELFEQAVAYYKALIPLHQRTQPNRGVGNSTLPNYYCSLARAWAGLKNTAEAVDAAASAIVSWSPRQGNRQYILETLKEVLRNSPNLDAYVKELDRQTADTGLGNPIVRKAIGQVYVERNEFGKAAVQLNLALELAPNDAETQQALIDCYDKQQDKEGAIRQTLKFLELARRDIKLAEKLGDRYGDLGRKQEAERAYTTIVEMLPNESESHTLLAEIRERQNRWDDAIAHWQEVARIRALEPTGLLKLAAAQIHQRQWAEAAATIEKLNAKGWPSRFGDVVSQTRDLERKTEDGRKKESPSAR